MHALYTVLIFTCVHTYFKEERQFANVPARTKILQNFACITPDIWWHDIHHHCHLLVLLSSYLGWNDFGSRQSCNLFLYFDTGEEEEEGKEAREKEYLRLHVCLYRPGLIVLHASKALQVREEEAPYPLPVSSACCYRISVGSKSLSSSFSISSYGHLNPVA